MDRRTFISSSLFTAAAPMLFEASGARAADPARPSQPKPSRMERLTAAIAANRMAVGFDGSRFSGAGYDWLVRRGSEAHAFLLGEEHGIAENPKLAAQLFTTLAPKGYRHVVVEISPPMSDVVERAGRQGGAAALRKALASRDTAIPFFGLKEEADWLTAAIAAVPRTTRAIWGIDYEVMADRHLIGELKSRPKPPAAAGALAKLEAASAASWAKYDETHNPQYIFSFAGDPELVRELRRAWPSADAHSRIVMDTLEQTLAINVLFVGGKGYDSNLLRAKFMRTNLLRWWRTKAPQDRVFMKMGASHLTRGPSFLTDIFDVGTMVPELVAERGGESFGMMVLPGPGTQTANFDPTRFRYVPGNRDQYGEGMELFDQAVLRGTFTLFDTAPLRPIASSASKGVPLPLWRVIHGFDAVLIMTGSHPSTNL